MSPFAVASSPEEPPAAQAKRPDLPSTSDTQLKTVERDSNGPRTPVRGGVEGLHFALIGVLRGVRDFGTEEGAEGGFNDTGMERRCFLASFL